MSLTERIPVRPSERQFVCGKVCTRFIVFNVLGIGGKPSPNIWSDAFRCEIYVDDLPLAAGGSYLHSRAAGHRRLGFSSLGQSQSR